MIKIEDRILAAALCAVPPGPFPLATIFPLFQKEISQADVRFALFQLQQRGQISILQSLTGDCLYMVAPEQHASIILRIFGVPERMESDSSSVNVSDRTRGMKDIVMDMLSFVHLISLRQPNLNRKGHVTKKIADEWANTLLFSKEHAEALLRRKQALTQYPASTAIVLDLCLRIGWISMSDGRIVLERERLSASLELSDQSLRQQIHSFWLQVYPPFDPLVRMIAHLLFDLPARQWLTWSDVERWWNDRVCSLLQSHKTVSIRSLADELSVWSELGWLEVGVTDQGELAFQTIMESNTNSNLYLQADFDVMLPFHDHYPLHHLLLNISELVSNDRMRVYRLSRNSLRKAYSRGWTADSVIERLKYYSEDNIPEAVEEALREWEHSVPVFHCEEAIIIRFESIDVTDAIAGMNEMSKWLRTDNKWKNDAYVLNRDEHKQLLDKLKQLGLIEEIDQPETQSNPIPPRGEAHIVDQKLAKELLIEQGIFHSPYRIDAYKQIVPNMDPAALYPGFGHIPRGWWQESRHYHVSTMRSIIEQAIQWGCDLYLKTAVGKIKVVPEQIYESGEGTLNVAGYELGKPFQLSLNAIESIQLALPGIPGEKFIANVRNFVI